MNTYKKIKNILASLLVVASFAAVTSTSFAGGGSWEAHQESFFITVNVPLGSSVYGYVDASVTAFGGGGDAFASVYGSNINADAYTSGAGTYQNVMFSDPSSYSDLGVYLCASGDGYAFAAIGW